MPPRPQEQNSGMGLRTKDHRDQRVQKEERESGRRERYVTDTASTTWPKYLQNKLVMPEVASSQTGTSLQTQA
jgi:hypothetical protein